MATTAVAMSTRRGCGGFDRGELSCRCRSVATQSAFTATLLPRCEWGRATLSYTLLAFATMTKAT